MQNDVIKITGQLLETKEGEFQGNAYGNLKLRASEVAENSILKYKVNVKRVDMKDLASKIDSQITILCEVVRGSSDEATLKVVGLE